MQILTVSPLGLRPKSSAPGKTFKKTLPTPASSLSTRSQGATRSPGTVVTNAARTLGSAEHFSLNPTGQALHTVMAGLSWVPLLTPASALLGALASMGVVDFVPASATNWLLLSPFLLTTFVFPAIDMLIGEQPPATRALKEVAGDGIWLRVTQVLYGVTSLVACYTLAVACNAAWVAHGSAALGQVFTMGFAAGLTAAFGAAVSHEAIHSRSKLLSGLGQLMLCWRLLWPYARSHFHHHLHVCTPEDHTTAHKGESIWQYFPRYVLGSYKVAWREEALDAKRKGKPVFNPGNGFLQAMAMQVGMLAVSYLVAGLPGLLMHIGAASFSILHFAILDYILHYGLTRVKMADGSWSPVTEHNSFNSGYILDNVLTWRAAVHYEHHITAAKPGHLLGFTPTDVQQTADVRHKRSSKVTDGAPRFLPGVPFFLAAQMTFIPPLFFKFMDPLADEANKAHRKALGLNH